MSSKFRKKAKGKSFDTEGRWPVKLSKNEKKNHQGAIVALDLCGNMFDTTSGLI